MSAKNDQPKPIEEKLPWYYYLYNTIKDTPLNLTLFFVSAFVFYKVVAITRKCVQSHKDNEKAKILQLPPLHRDFTVRELIEYNGTRQDGRILVAVNFNVYDVSCAKHFYGEDGTYPQYAGCDISRNLINFSADKIELKDFDDLSDLTEKQLSTLLEWDLQYGEKYPLVGHLVREREKNNIPQEKIDDNAEIEKFETKYMM